MDGDWAAAAKHCYGLESLDEMQTKLTPAIIAGFTAQGLSLYQGITLASIVEKETAAPEERPMVASVYYNRLAKNIALDADPSIIYAELLNGSYSGALHHEDLAFNSPYNTYKYPGLPPGPIANPGKSALEAAMHPAETEYYYFVGDGSGHHRFAQSLEELVDGAGDGPEARGLREDQRVADLKHGEGKSEKTTGNEVGSDERQCDPPQNLQAGRAIDQRAFLQLIGDRLEIADQEPSAERHQERRIHQDQR